MFPLQADYLVVGSVDLSVSYRTLDKICVKPRWLIVCEYGDGTPIVIETVLFKSFKRDAN